MSDLHSTNDSRITIREATDRDLAGLSRLAGLDSAALPAEPVLVAEVGDELRAEMSLRDGRAVADPFHRTGELVEMLRLRVNGAAPRPRSASRTRRPHGIGLRLRTAAQG